MRDLDMSDVIADAREMERQSLDQMYFELDRLSDDGIRRVRYDEGAEARAGDHYSINMVIAADTILLHRTVTTLCEGCLGRYGCDMCCPPSFTLADMYPGYDESDAHYEQFGRPEFPNEY